MTARLQASTFRWIGRICVAIGLINAFIPLMPTTIFLIMGAWAYGKGSPELREKLLNHPRFGPSLRLWIEQRRMTPASKRSAILAILATYLITLLVTGPHPITFAVGAGLGLLIIYLARAKEPETMLPSVQSESESNPPITLRETSNFE